MTPIPGYLGAIAANGPASLMVPSAITTAPAGITPDAPRRGSVIAYAPRMMMVSVIALHPCNSAVPGRRGYIFAPSGSTANKPGYAACPDHAWSMAAGPSSPGVGHRRPAGLAAHL